MLVVLKWNLEGTKRRLQTDDVCLVSEVLGEVKSFKLHELYPSFLIQTLDVSELAKCPLMRLFDKTRSYNPSKAGTLYEKRF